MMGSSRPYFRKHILNTLEPADYLFLNSFFITLFIIVYFTYIYFFDNHLVKRTYDNCCKLSYTQISALILLSFFTVISSLMFFHVEKHFNTPFINNILMKAFSLVALFLVGYFIFNESYTTRHMVGICLTFAGILVLLLNPMQSTP